MKNNLKIKPGGMESTVSNSTTYVKDLKSTEEARMPQTLYLTLKLLHGELPMVCVIP